MKLIVTASGKRSLRISKTEWESMGRENGWLTADIEDTVDIPQETISVPEPNPASTNVPETQEVLTTPEVADVEPSGIQSYLKKVDTKYGEKVFLVLYGNTRPIAKQLGKSGLGFKYFKPNATWNMPVDKVTPELREQLINLGVDVSCLDQPIPEKDQEISEEPSETPLASTEEKLAEMKTEVQDALKESGRNEKVRGLLTFIDRMIEKVGKMTDEAAQSEFVQSFIAFSAQFYNYSFRNQILIWIQNPRAKYVSGASDWLKKGRIVTNFGKENAISILAPMTKKYDFNEDERAGLSEEEVAAGKKRTFFSPVQIYDIADTEPIPGWKDRKGNDPFEPKEWRQDSNEAIGEMTFLINAAWDWAKESQKIDIDVEEMSGSLGGFSAGGKVRINNTYDGINKFSTLVHEMAHELLHWDQITKKRPTDMQEGKKDKEIDAETTAYIVLKHYGFDTEDSPNYLALWKADAESIKMRRDNIHKAVKEIINGIDGVIRSRNMDVDQLTDAVDEATDKIDQEKEKIAGLQNFITNISGSLGLT